MTTKTDLLGNLRLEWRRVGRSPSAREATRRLDERHRELRLEAQDDLFDVVALLESRSGRNVLERAQIVRALLEEASNPDVHRALLQTLLPGVVSVCRQLRFGDGIIDDPGETLSMAVSLLSELLIDWAGQSRQYAAPDLLSALRGRLRRWLLKEKEALKNVSLRPGRSSRRRVVTAAHATREPSRRRTRPSRSTHLRSRLRGTIVP